jgi:hypothetical protein
MEINSMENFLLGYIAIMVTVCSIGLAILNNK